MIVMIVWAIEIPSLSASSLSLNVKMGRIQTSLFHSFISSNQFPLIIEIDKDLARWFNYPRNSFGRFPMNIKAHRTDSNQRLIHPPPHLEKGI